MQTTLFGGQGILPEMPAALHLESGILGKCRLSDGDDCFAARLDIFILVFLLCRDFYEINQSPHLNSEGNNALCSGRFGLKQTFAG